METTRLKRAGEISLVPFEQIVIDDNINNARLDFGNIAELADSIEESGLKIPLLVKKVRGEDKYTLIQGKRRLKAISILIARGVEFAGIKCFLAPTNYSVENSLFDQIIMNDGKPYSNLEQGLVFSQLVDRGYEVKEISKKVAKSTTHILNCIEMTALPKKVQNLIASGAVSGLTAVNLSKVVDSEEDLLAQIEAAVTEVSVSSGGQKKKVTNKNIKSIASLSPLKKMEAVKFKLEAEGDAVDLRLVDFFERLVSRLKAKENVDSIIELFKK